MEKRCFNTGEALQYLGIKRRSFEAHILPSLRGKGIRIGNCVVFERGDLDTAWDCYKILAGSGNKRSGLKGEKWNAERSPVFTPAKRDTTLTEYTKANAFANVASQVLKRQKTG